MSVRAPLDRGVRKAVIPVAGLGTRFLPATKATPKEMLPVVDVPAIQYVVEEAVRAGCRDVLLVTGRNKRAVEDHFDRAHELEAALAAKGDQERLDLVRRPSELAAMHYVRQGEPRGLGHAVGCAAEHVGDEPFAVLLGDDLVDPRDPLLDRMIDVRERRGGCVLALLEVPREQVSLYGCAGGIPVDGEPDLVRVTDLVEKPSPEQAPGNLAVVGRYVLDPAVFAALGRTSPGRGGEVQLTDALRELVAVGVPVHGVLFRGRRYDIGDRQGYLRAVVRLACERPDLGPDFRAWLGRFVAAADGVAS